MPNRREFLKVTGLGGMATLSGKLPGMIDPIEDPKEEYPWTWRELDKWGE